MNRLAIALCLGLAVAGCDRLGGGEDFAIPINRTSAALYAPLSIGKLPPEIAAVFPGLRVDRSRPDDNSILYTIPGSGSAPSTILLVFESQEGGRASLVHATVEVPAIRTVIDGKQKIISEVKVERVLQAMIRNHDKHDLDRELSGLLGAIAIATDKKAMAEVQQMMRNPERYMATLSAMDSELFDNYDPATDAETVDRPEGAAADPVSDPDAALAREANRQSAAEWREQRNLGAAAAAEDSASGAEPEPELPSSE